MGLLATRFGRRALPVLTFLASALAFAPAAQASFDFELPAQTVDTGGTPTDVVTADFNNDGRLDVAASNTTDAVIAVRLGARGGGFGSTATYPVTDPRGIAARDLTGDGVPDIAVASNSTNSVVT